MRKQNNEPPGNRSADSAACAHRRLSRSLSCTFLIHAPLRPERCLTQRRIKAFPFVWLEGDEKLAHECTFQLKTSEIAWTKTTTGKNYC
jgi:hypothetical protein